MSLSLVRSWGGFGDTGRDWEGVWRHREGLGGVLGTLRGTEGSWGHWVGTGRDWEGFGGTVMGLGRTGRGFGGTRR